MTKYYGTRESGDGYRGVVYTYDDAGEIEVTLYRTEETFHNQPAAIDAVVEWLESMELEAEME